MEEKQEGLDVISICDDPRWDCLNFNPSEHTLDLNKTIIRELKELGFDFIDIGDPPFPINSSSNYSMEILELFGG